MATASPSSSSSKANLLAIGFPLTSASDPKGTIIAEQTALAASQGYALYFLLVDPVNNPVDAVLQELVAALDAREYAVVSIGYGVRGNRDLTEVFERMVNLVRERQGGARLAFARLPDEVVDACLRVLE